MRLGLPSLVFDRESMPDLGSLGVNLSRLPTVTPKQTVTVTDRATGLPAEGPPAYVAPKSVTLENIGTSTQQGGVPGSAWWQDAGYPDAATAIQSGNFRYDMNTGWQLKPGAETPAMKLATATTPEPAFVAPPEVIQSAIENLPVTIGAMTSPDLGLLGTSGMSVFEDEPITMASDSTSPMSPMAEPEVTLSSSDSVGMKAQEYQDFLDKLGSTKVDEELKNLFPTDQTDPVQAAVDAAVGNGQPTTDDTILDKDAMEDKVYLSYGA